MKVVINSCYGGFDLSAQAIKRYCELKGLTIYPEVDEEWGFVNYYTKPANERKDTNDGYFATYLIERNDPMLVKTVEELGRKSFGAFSNLKIVEIPDDVEWIIEEYDGMEHIAEKHRIWK